MATLEIILIYIGSTYLLMLIGVIISIYKIQNDENFAGYKSTPKATKTILSFALAFAPLVFPIVVFVYVKDFIDGENDKIR